MARVACTKSQRLCNRFNDYIRGEMKRQHKRQQDLADYMNVARSTLGNKLTGVNPWTLLEALEAVEFVDGDPAEAFR